MKELDLREVIKTSDFKKLFIGRILTVDTAEMMATVELQDILGVVNVSLFFHYISDIAGGYMVYVPVIGDTVIIGMSQSANWEVVGYRMNRLTTDEHSTWGLMRKTDQYTQPIELQKGDFAIGIRKDENNVDLLMLGNGKMVLTAGLVYVILNQNDNSLRQIMSYCICGNGKMIQDWGEARFISDGKEQVIKDEQLWRVKNEEKEEIALGCINKKGIIEKDSKDSPIRFRVKINETEILINKNGEVAINAQNGFILKIQQTGEMIEIKNSGINIISDSVNIETKFNQEGDVNIKGDINVEGKINISDSLDVGKKITALEGGDVGGVTALVLETILPLLTNHTHSYVLPAKPAGLASTSPSLQLTQATKYKTKRLRAG